MQTGLIIYLNRARIKEPEVNNKLQNDFFTFWFQKLRNLYYLGNIKGLVLLSLYF